MNWCNNCDFRGYSEEICYMHSKHLASHAKVEVKAEARVKAKEIERLAGGKVVTAALYGGTCVLGVTLVLASAPVLGFGLVANAVAIKVSAGLVGGAMGSLKALRNRKK